MARIVSAVIGLLLGLCSLGLLGTGGVARWQHDPAARRRDRPGYLGLPQHRLRRRQQHGGPVRSDRWPARAAVAARHRKDQRHTSSPCWPGVRRDRPGWRGQPLPGRGRLRHRPRHHPLPPGLHRAHRRHPRDRARPGRHLGRPRGRPWHPDTDLADTTARCRRCEPGCGGGGLSATGPGGGHERGAGTHRARTAIADGRCAAVALLGEPGGGGGDLCLLSVGLPAGHLGEGRNGIRRDRDAG
jgi:hypothetical protein